MSTVPVLTIAAVDQTDFVQDKTLTIRLQTLDVVLVDPVTSPALHDGVTLDVPAWAGRVSTIESNPYKAKDGTYHRWVKLTCTNKHVAAGASAPFGLSDTPNHSTTYDYAKDFTYTQTLSDQTDLSTAEHRIACTIFRAGIVPGMTVAVTNSAESLSAVDFVVTQVTVDWLNDDFAKYHLEGSIEGVPPVTLGDIIASQGCDCPPFVCTPTDFHAFPDPGLTCVINASNPGGDRTCRSDVDHSPPQHIYLYAGAVYKVRYSVFHGGNDWGLSANMLDNHGTYFGFDAGGTDPASPFFPPLALSDWITGSVPYDNYYEAYLHDFVRAGNDGIDSSIFAEIVYVSGPDPRFESLGPCSNGNPDPGQPISPEHLTGDGSTTAFTTAWPYMPGSLQVIVEGVDWSDQVVEDDATAGDYSLAYAPPAATDPEPNVEVYYRYPK